MHPATQISRFAVLHPIIVLIAVALVSIGALWVVNERLRFDETLVTTAANDTPEGLLAATIENDVNGLEGSTLWVLVSGEPLFEGEGLEAFREFEEELRFVEGVDRVTSVFSLFAPPEVPEEEGAPIDFSYLEPLLETKGVSDVLLDPFARAGLVAPNGRATIVSIVLTADDEFEDPPPRADVLAEIKALGRTLEENSRLSAKLTGYPVLTHDLLTSIKRDQAMFTIAGGTAGVLMCLIFFTGLFGIILVAITPLIALALSFGVMAILDVPIDVITNVMPSLVLVIALADAVHLALSFGRAREDNPHATDIEIALEGVRMVAPACFLTTLTTALAFLTLALSGVPSVTDLGLVCFFGAICAFFAVVLVIPAGAGLLARYDRLWQLNIRRPIEDWTQSAMDWVGHVTERRASFLTFAGGAMLVIALASLSRMDLDFHIRENFASGSQSDVAFEQADRAFDGVVQFSVVLKKTDASTIDTGDPEFWSLLSAVHHQVSARDDVAEPLSLWSIASWLDLDSAKAAYYGEDFFSLAQQGESFGNGLVGPNGSFVAIQSRIRDAGAKANRITFDGVRSDLSSLFETYPQYSFQVSGISVNISKNSQRDLRTLLISLFVAVVIAMLVLAFAFRDIGLWRAALFVNLAPILGVLAALLLLSGVVRIAALLALTIAIGIAVDDSIHMVSSIKRRRRHAGGGDPIKSALKDTGPAVLYTTALLVTGLLPTLFSAVPTVRQFALVALSSLIIALLADLLLLPAVTRWTDGAKRKQT